MFFLVDLPPRRKWTAWTCSNLLKYVIPLTSFSKQLHFWKICTFYLFYLLIFSVDVLVDWFSSGLDRLTAARDVTVFSKFKVEETRSFGKKRDRGSKNVKSEKRFWKAKQKPRRAMRTFLYFCVSSKTIRRCLFLQVDGSQNCKDLSSRCNFAWLLKGEKVKKKWWFAFHSLKDYVATRIAV